MRMMYVHDKHVYVHDKHVYVHGKHVYMHGKHVYKHDKDLYVRPHPHTTQHPSHNTTQHHTHHTTPITQHPSHKPTPITGSMVVHLMTAEQRKAVDLEGLWTAGEPHRVRRIVAGEGMPLTLDTITAEDV